MLKKSVKYLFIAIINLIVLTGLLVLWADNLELIFDDWIRPIEFLKIFGFTLFSLIGMRFLVSYFRKRNIQGVKKRIKLACLLTVLISSGVRI
jgi:hypothetical protein